MTRRGTGFIPRWDPLFRPTHLARVDSRTTACGRRLTDNVKIARGRQAFDELPRDQRCKACRRIEARQVA